MRECIVPSIDIDRTVLDRTDRVFPLVAGSLVRSLHNATAGKAEDTRFQFLQSLCQISTHAVRTVVECLLWKQ